MPTNKELKNYFHFLQNMTKAIENNTEKESDPEYTCCGVVVDDEIRSAGVCSICSTPPNTDGTYGEPKE